MSDRLEALLADLITEQSRGEWDDEKVKGDVQMFAPPLRSMMKAARDDGLRDAARAVAAVTARITGTPYSVGGRLFSQAVLALIDAPDMEDCK